MLTVVAADLLRRDSSHLRMPDVLATCHINNSSTTFSDPQNVLIDAM